MDSIGHNVALLGTLVQYKNSFPQPKIVKKNTKTNCWRQINNNIHNIP